MEERRTAQKTENLDEAQRKAEVLIEALPYIQRYHSKIIVVKYGGSAMSDPGLQRSVISDVALLRLVGFQPILVHGGGKAISGWISRTGGEARFVNGLRVTDEATMEIAEMVLNRVNKQLVAMMEELGVRSVGISGKDGRLLHCRRKLVEGEDIGFVGEIERVNPGVLLDLLEKDYLPVVAPTGLDSSYQTYNINADDAACAIAKAVGAYKLVFLTDVEGVYRDFEDKSSFLSRLTVSEARALMEGGVVGGGMLPKLGNCLSAVEAGVDRVHILDGRIPHSMLLEIFTDRGIGTMFCPDGDEL